MKTNKITAKDKSEQIKNYSEHFAELGIKNKWYDTSFINKTSPAVIDYYLSKTTTVSIHTLLIRLISNKNINDKELQGDVETLKTLLFVAGITYAMENPSIFKCFKEFEDDAKDLKSWTKSEIDKIKKNAGSEDEDGSSMYG